MNEEIKQRITLIFILLISFSLGMILDAVLQNETDKSNNHFEIDAKDYVPAERITFAPQNYTTWKFKENTTWNDFKDIAIAMNLTFTYISPSEEDNQK